MDEKVAKYIATDTCVISGMKQRIAELEAERDNWRKHSEDCESRLERTNVELKYEKQANREGFHHQMNQADRIRNLEAERDRAVADNAELLDELNSACWHPHDANSANDLCWNCGVNDCEPHTDDCVLAQDHPGTSLLEELAALRKVAEAAHEHSTKESNDSWSRLREALTELDATPSIAKSTPQS